MKANGNIMLERLKENAGANDGCSVVFIKMLKSDLSKVLRGYTKFSDIDIDVRQFEDGSLLTVSVAVDEFFDMGNGGNSL